ncbi:MAG: hypothetical protein JXR49_13215 [Acidobacteria bacterium]|nr:hypothetical protein [Acidobacteriota bacterium]
MVQATGMVVARNGPLLIAAHPAEAVGIKLKLYTKKAMFVALNRHY